VFRWREWLFERFGRGGYFSLRPLPMTEAERKQNAESHATPADITRLNLDTEKSSHK
jgi:hypothetical protein